MSLSEFRKEFKIPGWKIVLEKRPKSGFMGRFGGGWNWKFGFQVGSKSIIFSILVMQLIIRKETP